jgi:hypothetical protein
MARDSASIKQDELGWSYRTGLDGRFLLLPLFVAPLSVLWRIAPVVWSSGLPIRWSHADLTAILIGFYLFFGVIGILPGILGWLCGWALARFFGVGRYLASIIAAGMAAFAAAFAVLLVPFLTDRKILDWPMLCSIGTFALELGLVAMLVGAVLYKNRRGDAVRGIE